MVDPGVSIEKQRLQAHYDGEKNWLKWGPYLSERQWGTVREDYSANGNAWSYFTHGDARSRAYRWGEDGIAGICDDLCNLCFAVAMWNGKDPFIKERLFGLTGPQGNHGEDVKELYYYLDSTPTHSYMKHLYKYPQSVFPYDELIRVNRERSRFEMEYELLDTGIFKHNQYFDICTEYAKAGEEDILIRITAYNRSQEPAELHLLPTLWFRNLWHFGLMEHKPTIKLKEKDDEWICLEAKHDILGAYHLYADRPEQILFTENDTNEARLFGVPNVSPFVKDSINDAVVKRDYSLLEGKTEGTKFSPLYKSVIAGESQFSVHLRLCKVSPQGPPLKDEFDRIFVQRIEEADEFYRKMSEKTLDPELANIQRQAFSGMLWTKQYYNIDIPRWLEGDPGLPKPPLSRKFGRNKDWMTLNNEDIISMPDKWEYPWYAAWDLAFHCIPLALVDGEFAKEQLILFLREWYMKPNGQIPAYEWSFGDVNPPVHAWACMEVYRIDKKSQGKGDIDFLKRVFQKLLINFTWWVNQKDHNDNNVFEAGFLGLDNIGVFDRSEGIPEGGILEQADGTSWMAMYCLNMLDMAIEIAQEDATFEDVATKFLEHFIYIAESLNHIGQNWIGSWDEEDGFFYDILELPNHGYIPLKIRSLVGLTSLFATLELDKKKLEKVPDFKMRLEWFRNYRIENNSSTVIEELEDGEDILLSLIPKKRLSKLLAALLDEEEFLSSGGIRSLSKVHQDPYLVQIGGQEFSLNYEPGESTTGLFGGNSNWRGPVWMPMNYLIIESLKEYYKYYREDLKVECPKNSGKMMNLDEVANDISQRLIHLFLPDEFGNRPINDGNEQYRQDPHFKDLVLFYEYFHGDSGRGMGASHQSGWTGLIAELIAREAV